MNRRRVEVGLWDRLTQIVLLLLLGLAMLAVVLWYWPVIQKNEGMKRQILGLEQQVRHEEAIARRLKESIEALRDHPKTVERMARDKLGYARPGETLVHFGSVKRALPVQTNSKSR